MAYNHGLAKKKFDKQWQNNEKLYRQHGMTDEQISAIRELDEEIFNSERIYLERKVSLTEANDLRKTFMDETAFGKIEENWHEYIEDKEKYQKLLHVPTEMRKAYYMNIVMKISQHDISLILNKPQRTISYWIIKISKILK